MWVCYRTWRDCFRCENRFDVCSTLFIFCGTSSCAFNVLIWSGCYLSPEDAHHSRKLIPKLQDFGFLTKCISCVLFFLGLDSKRLTSFDKLRSNWLYHVNFWFCFPFTLNNSSNHSATCLHSCCYSFWIPKRKRKRLAELGSVCNQTRKSRSKTSKFYIKIAWVRNNWNVFAFYDFNLHTYNPIWFITSWYFQC